MFEVNTYRQLDSSLPKIVANYKVYHYDEWPILFSGTNQFGNKIVGSFVEEDEDEDVFRYFLFLVSDEDFYNFITKKISYKDLLLGSDQVFIQDRNINDKVLKQYLIPVSEIPEDYLPLEGALCPTHSSQFGYDFTASLKGAFADLHMTIPAALNSVQGAYSKILNEITELLRGIKVDARVLQKAYAKGSFELNFTIKIVEQTTLFGGGDTEKRLAFISKSLDYSLNHLAAEAPLLQSGQFSNSEKFNEFEELAKDVFESESIVWEEKHRDKIVDTLIKVIPNLAEIGNSAGEAFEKVEFLNRNTESGDEVILGQLDREKGHLFKTVQKQISAKGEEIEDDDFSEFKVWIYSFNTDSRKGSGHILLDLEEMTTETCKVTILGSEDLAQTRYTESLYKHQFINVKAKAIRMEDKIKRLKIEFES